MREYAGCRVRTVDTLHFGSGSERSSRLLLTYFTFYVLFFSCTFPFFIFTFSFDFLRNFSSLSLSLFLSLSVSIYTYIHIYIYLYTEGERVKKGEKERGTIRRRKRRESQ